ncbi:MAG: ribonuclease HII [Nanoarchaeota archaeon]|nr:ribonuclease HII [Nanoarchaeota archaeon]
MGDKETFVLGIDEAGKGPVVGPLVIAGALFKKSDLKKLKKIGVKDSKLIPPQKREELLEEIKKIALRHMIIKVNPIEIDQRFSVSTNLNQLEAIKFAEIINELKPDVAVIDTPTVNTKGFENYLRRFLEHECELKCENYADKNHVEVGAASIIAKVERDKEIKSIEEKIGEEIGAGYPSDPTTIKFVEKAFKTKKWLEHIRKTWFTFQRIKEENEQKKLSEW